MAKHCIFLTSAGKYTGKGLALQELVERDRTIVRCCEALSLQNPPLCASQKGIRPETYSQHVDALFSWHISTP
jgi:hypothetical protein